MRLSKILLLLCALALATPSFAKKTNDSLLLKLFHNAELYDRVVRHYESDIYVKGTIHLKGKNKLMKRVPQSPSFARGVKDYLGESFGSLDYTAPFSFDRDIKVVNGTYPTMKQDQDMVLDFFKLTIYRESLIDDHLLSPFHEHNTKYYKYSLDSIKGSRYFYSYKPKYNNTQLVKGKFVVNRDRVVVEEAEFIGSYEFMKFDLTVFMGAGGFMAYLPTRYEVDYRFNFVGNKMEGSYQTVQNYNKVEVVYEPNSRPATSKYDLSNRYALTTDTVRVVVDSAFIAQHRFLPLSGQEQTLYERWAHRRDSISKLPPSKHRKSFSDSMEDILFSHNYIHLGSKLGAVRMNPLLDVGLFNYSSTKGYSYRQDFKYVYTYKDLREMIIRPRLGYNIKFKQFFWRLITRYNYWPEKMGALEFEIGNGNRIRGSIKDPFYSGYFSDNYGQVKHEIEIANGLKFTAGLVYHARQPWKMSKAEASELGIRHTYKSFSPNLRLQWTPGQYFYRDRKKKVNVYSRFPTFAIDWERGIKGVFGSTSSYERVEGDISYEWEPDNMHKFSWRLAGGKFTNTEILEFVDYHSFKKHYLPESWEDELGGRFTLLDSHWYNETPYYLRAHMIYETPMLFLGRLNSKWIQRERIYAGVLRGDFSSRSEKDDPDFPGSKIVTYNRFHNYYEVGYGFATALFDLGFYASFRNGKYSEWGIKYNFTLWH